MYRDMRDTRERLIAKSVRATRTYRGDDVEVAAILRSPAT
jgi:hypothetical protein